MIKAIILLVLLLLYIILKKKPKIEKFFNSKFLKDHEVILYFIKLSNNNLQKISILDFEKKKKFMLPLNKLNILDNQISDKTEPNSIILIVDKFYEQDDKPQILFSDFDELLKKIIKIIEINLLYRQLLNRKPNQNEIEDNKNKNFLEIQNDIQNSKNYKKPDKYLEITDIYTSNNPKKTKLQNWEIRIVNEVLKNYQIFSKSQEIQETLEKNLILSPSPAPVISNIDDIDIIPPTISNNEKKKRFCKFGIYFPKSKLR